MELYLVTTDHLEECIWFRDEEDFKAAMNAVAILAFVLKINILAFILMSNHVHFLLECSYEKAREFIRAFKQHHSRYMHCKYGVRRCCGKTPLTSSVSSCQMSPRKELSPTF